MGHLNTVVLIIASLSFLTTISGAVVYLPQTVNQAQPSFIADFLAGLTLVLGSMIIGRILQWILRLMKKAKLGIIGGGIK